MEQKLEYTKMEERMVWSINKIKELSKKEGIEFDKDLFLEGINTARTLFVRSEIAYSGKKS